MVDLFYSERREIFGYKKSISRHKMVEKQLWFRTKYNTNIEIVGRVMEL